MMEINKSRFKIIIAMIIWGTVGVFVKEIKLSSIEIALYRSIIGVIFTTTLSLFLKEKWDRQDLKVDLPILVVSGVALGMGWVFLFQGYKNTSVSIATLSYYIAPIFIVLLSFLVLKEKITSKKILSIIGAMIGLFLIINTKNNMSSGEYNHMLGILYSLTAAVFYAIVVILNKFIKRLSGIKVTIIQLLTSTLVLMPVALLNNPSGINKVDLKSLILLILIGTIHTGVAYLLYFSSVKEVEGQSIAVLSYIDPIFALFISGIFLGEKMSIIQVLGGILILGSAYISERKG